MERKFGNQNSNKNLTLSLSDILETFLGRNLQSLLWLDLWQHRGIYLSLIGFPCRRYVLDKCLQCEQEELNPKVLAKASIYLKKINCPKAEIKLFPQMMVHKEEVFLLPLGRKQVLQLQAYYYHIHYNSESLSLLVSLI